MRGFTLIELLVVLFIISTITFIAFPRLWSWMPADDSSAVGSALKGLREEAMASKKETFFTADFGSRRFSFRSPKARPDTRIIEMREGEQWEVFIPSRGAVKEGQITVPFSPAVQEELIALYLNKNGKDITIILDNLSGELEIEDGRRRFDD